MKAQFAKAMAANIRKIAENTAQIALIDNLPAKAPEHYVARAQMANECDKAESNIAQILMQPGACPAEKRERSLRRYA